MNKLKTLIALLLVPVMTAAVPVYAEDESTETIIAAATIECEEEGSQAGIQGPEEIEIPEVMRDEEECEVWESDTPLYRSAETYQSQTEVFDALEKLIREALLDPKNYDAGTSDMSDGTMSVRISIASLNINRNQFPRTWAIYKYSPYFNNSVDIKVSYYTSKPYYSSMLLTNSMTYDETVKYIEAADSKVEEVKQFVEKGKDNIEKLLRLHDYLGIECAYDYENYQQNTLPDTSYRSSGPLMLKKAVCDGYAHAFQYICSKVGIECFVTSSKVLNHAWNIVKLDGAYYHIDCTWDDPTEDIIGRVIHENFLLSDQGMRTTKRAHYGWDRTDLACISTAYENAYWKEIRTQIVWENGKQYYGTNIALYCREGDTEVKIADLGYWPVHTQPGYAWSEVYAGIFFGEGYLYYNTASEIRRIKLSDMTEQRVFILEDDACSVYGIKKEGNKIAYVVGSAPTVSGAVYWIDIETIPEPEPVSLPSYIRGDLTEDKKVNIDDLRLMLRIVCGKVTASPAQMRSGDLDGSGRIDVADLRVLLRFVCGKITSI